jgi:hypothetical protein
MPHTAATFSPPDYIKYFHPRVERSAMLSMYTRAQGDARPASVAHLARGGGLRAEVLRSQFPPPGASQWGSVALPETLSASMAGSDFRPATVARAGRLTRGERRNIFKVERLGDDHYRFEQKGSAALEPEAGTLRDRDTVAVALEKLHALYPQRVPLSVLHGDAVAKGAPAARQVRTVLESRGTLLVEDEPLGVQCLKSTFSKYFRPRGERAVRVNLAARGRTDSRGWPDAVAWLTPEEYMQRSTSRAVI